MVPYRKLASVTSAVFSRHAAFAVLMEFVSSPVLSSALAREVIMVTMRDSVMPRSFSTTTAL